MRDRGDSLKVCLLTTSETSSPRGCGALKKDGCRLWPQEQAKRDSIGEGEAVQQHTEPPEKAGEAHVESAQGILPDQMKRRRAPRGERDHGGICGLPITEATVSMASPCIPLCVVQVVRKAEKGGTSLSLHAACSSASYRIPPHRRPLSMPPGSMELSNKLPLSSMPTWRMCYFDLGFRHARCIGSCSTPSDVCTANGSTPPVVPPLPTRTADTRSSRCISANAYLSRVEPDSSAHTSAIVC